MEKASVLTSVEAEREEAARKETAIQRRAEQAAKAKKRAVKAARRAAVARAHLEEQRKMEQLILSLERQAVDRHWEEQAKWRMRRGAEERYATCS